jgi:uncharacterized membrane protein YedE/YeeE
MQMSELNSLGQQVLLVSFVLSAVFGAIAQRTHFCTMGAVSDVVNMGDWTRMRQWGLAIGVAMIGFGALVYLGRVDAAKTLYSTTRVQWLSALVGGAMFGFGMVLASGCGSKTLVRIGGGSLKSLVVFVVMGVASYATLRGVTAVARVATVDRVAVDMAQGTLMSQVVAAASGQRAQLVGLLLALVLGGALIAWAMAGRGFRERDNLLAGFGLGAVVTGMWWASGSLGFVAEHPETLEQVYLTTNSGRIEAMSFVAPVAYTLDWLMLFSDKNKVLTFSVVSVLGVISGSAVWALVSRSFRWEGFGGTEDVANHLVGAVLMGVGGVTALGCTVGQGLSGVSTLSLTSFVALAAIIAGAVGGFRYQIWRLERSA